MEFILTLCGYLVEFKWKTIRILDGIWILIVHVMPFHSLWMGCWHCLVASYWHCLVASLSISMSPCSCLVYLGERRMYHVICRNLTMTFPHTVESGYYIYINVSEIHSGNCGKSTAHTQNVILTLIGLGLFDMFLEGRGDIRPLLSHSKSNRPSKCYLKYDKISIKLLTS